MHIFHHLLGLNCLLRWFVQEQDFVYLCVLEDVEYTLCPSFWLGRKTHRLLEYPKDLASFCRRPSADSAFQVATFATNCLLPKEHFVNCYQSFRFSTDSMQSAGLRIVSMFNLNDQMSN